MTYNDPPPLWQWPPTPVAAPVGTQGWECPKCHGTYAPWIACCTECKPPAPSLRQRVEQARPVPRIAGPLPPALSIDTARTTMGSGAVTPATCTLTLTRGKSYELNPDEGDDGAAGVPARV